MRIYTTGLRMVLTLPLGALAVFCVAYGVGDYEALARWWLGLPGPVYKAATWQTTFFTPAVKQSGDLICGSALVGIGILISAIWVQKFPERPVAFRKQLYPYLGIGMAALVLGIWSAASLPPAADEAFSAKYAAGSHPFRALSYYMLPNNHVLFNTLNAFISDESSALWHGRILSVLAYVGSGLLAYRWLQDVLSGRKAAFGITLLVLALFPVWGFAGQARGYELYLLAHWWCLILVTRYLKTSDPRQLYGYPVAMTIGYGAVPTFLYFHLALMIWMGFMSWRDAKNYKSFWQAQLPALLGVFLLYVPVLCFSGTAALLQNNYVSGGGKMPWDSLPPFGPYAPYLNGMAPGGRLLGLLVLVLGGSLLFRKKTRCWGVLFILLWLVTDGVVLKMQRIPFHRNLIGLYAISGALAGVAVVNLAKALPENRLRKWRSGLGLGAVGLAGGVLLFTGQKQLSENLYFYPVREAAAQLEATVFAEIPAGSAVAFSEESVLAEAIWKERGRAVVLRPDAAYWLQLQDERDSQPADSLLITSGDLQLYFRKR